MSKKKNNHPASPSQSTTSDVADKDAAEMTTEHRDESNQTATKTVPDSVAHQPSDASTTVTKKAATETVSQQQKKSKTSTASGNSFASQAATAPSKLPLIVVCLLFICLAAVGAYFSWTTWKSQQARLESVESQLSQQTSTLTAIDSDQSTFVKQQQRGLSALKQSVEKQQQLLQRRIESHSQRISALSGTTRDDWMLAEARYLLRLANQRLLVDGGAISAIGLLESADKILLSIDSPDLFPIRDAISKDIIALKLAPAIDREGLYLQLSALIAQIDQLPLVPLTRDTLVKELAQESESAPQNKNTTETEALDQPNIDGPWYQTMWGSVKKAFGHLDRYVKVRDHDAESKPLISSALQQQVRQNIRLTLEHSQIALLREENTIYQESLKQAAALINKHFTHYAERQILVEELSRLQRQPIVQSLPDISRSLELLTRYTERFHKLTPKNNPSSGVDVKSSDVPQKKLPLNKRQSNTQQQQDDKKETAI